MPTPDDEGSRRALVVATGSYADATLAGLRAPGRDAAELAAILEDAAVGGFDVETILDEPADALRRRVARFCAQGGPGDLALLYVSCHGVLDDRGRLYYATTDTDRELLAATAIPAAWLNEQLDDCRCRRQIVILDCCHSGAFAKGAKGEGSLALRERFEGRGRVVLTASRATEYSFEGDRVLGDGVSSVFTDVLVHGLRSGEADRDGDGAITVAELYEYAYEAVRARDGRQTPMLWTYGAEGGLLVARSARGAVTEPVPLPDEVMALLESARPRLREGAVAELADVLAGPDAGRALTARAQLERVAAQDIPSVAALARAALDGEPPGAEPPPPAAPPPPPSRRRRPSWRALAVAAVFVALFAAAVVVELLTGTDPDSAPSVPRSGPIAIGGGPGGIASGNGATWIARHDAGTVSWIGADSRVRSIEVGPNPETVAADDDGTVWVVTRDGAGLTRIDAATHEVAQRIEQGADARQEECGDCPPPDLAIARDALWVGVPRTGDIVRRDLVGGDATGSWGVPAGFDGRFAAQPDGRFLWAVGSTGDDPPWVARVDLESERDTPPEPLEHVGHPSAVAVGEDAVWIADDHRDTVTRLDRRLPIRQYPPIKVPHVTSDDIAVAGGDVLLWDPSGGTLTRIDPATRDVVPIPVPGYTRNDPTNLRLSELAVVDGVAWVTDPKAGRVLRVPY
jgi:uncharacterized caspase-like protein/streptogramin lyase